MTKFLIYLCFFCKIGNWIKNAWNKIVDALKEIGNIRKLLRHSSYVYAVWQTFKYEYLDKVKPSKQGRGKLLTPELTERFAKLYDEYSYDWFPRMKRIKQVVQASGYKALSLIDRRPS